MKMEGKRSSGRPKLRWNDTVRRDLKAWNGPLTEKGGKVSARPANPNRQTAAKGEKNKYVGHVEPKKIPAKLSLNWLFLR